jgi:Tol biopolymer transport system component
VDSAGVPGNGASYAAAISSDDNFVAFDSLASNLVPSDTNAKRDVFVHDSQTGATERVSVDSAGAQGTSDSLSPAVNSDGRYVAFQSFANNLVVDDTALCGPPPGYSCPDIFVRDRQTGTTERVSLSSAEEQANGESWAAAISGDGRYVAFYSSAANLVSGDANNVEDIFVRDRQVGTTTRVSVASGGAEANGASNGWLAISGTGRYVAFTSDATNLVAGDTNGSGDVFVRDRDTDADGTFDEAGAVSTTRVSVSSGGAQSNGESYYAAISGDGRYVAFGSEATNLVASDTNGYGDVFVRDRQMASTTRVSLDSAGVQGNAGSFAPAINADGQYVAFHSYATNLVAHDTNAATDVFVRDRQAGTTTLVSVDSVGFQGNAASVAPAISGDGRFIAFSSEANLVLWDTNGASDIFLHDRLSSSVGGIAELPAIAHDSGRPEIDRTLLAGVAAVALAILSAGGWYAARRFRRGW